MWRLPVVGLVCALAATAQSGAPLTAREKMLLDRVEKLETRLAALEAKSSGENVTAVVAVKEPPAAAPPSEPAPSLLGGTTINGYFDGYYGYNFNSPVGRANLLRAYDVSSNSFSINQTGLIIENAPDVDHGKRWGARLDLQFGQATQTLQGNSANELRPEIYRPIFQAYGTYVIPVGSGITVDVGKFASSLGMEGNYSKDQINYSRSYLFNYLPFYHMGARANYHFNQKVAVNYWVVNGAQQTEAAKGYKDSFFNVTLTPHKTLTWTLNYYLGQEHPDVVYYPNGVPAGAPSNLPTLQGVPFQPIAQAPTGKLHVMDSYAVWQANARLLLAAEADYVVMREYPNSPPRHVSAGAAYARYQLTPKMAVGGRTEYFSDRGGLFTGTSQALKEFTFTWEYKLAEGFLVREEYRRDFSNQRYFLTDTLGLLKKDQTTATMGLVFWFGGKQGGW